ncbi:H/ACA ribonucleoprotein complex subunit NHP2 [Paramyrothecium foliicola]|nr:H/ACA ribonucleoprotein complex subunit NHP2 [Paramyrothecium foliicola]
MAAERSDKKEKKDKKRSDESGVKKDKKDKKDKKEKKDKLAAALEEKLQQDAASQSADAVKAPKADADDEDMEVDKPAGAEVPLERAVVAFAVPLADDKGTKKVYKTIRKAAKNNTLKRGVKEVVKALRKSPPSAPGYTSFPGLVIIAGDISPMDVISHIPVLCEDHNVPFIFVSSRAELGAAAKTKRPTSVVMIMEKRDPKAKDPKKDAKEDGEDDGEAYAETYSSLAKYMQKEYTKQGFWVQGESKA